MNQGSIANKTSERSNQRRFGDSPTSFVRLLYTLYSFLFLRVFFTSCSTILQYVSTDAFLCFGGMKVDFFRNLLEFTGIVLSTFVDSNIVVVPTFSFLKNSRSLIDLKNLWKSIMVLNSSVSVVGTKDKPFLRADSHAVERGLSLRFMMLIISWWSGCCRRSVGLWVFLCPLRVFFLVLVVVSGLLGCGRRLVLKKRPGRVRSSPTSCPSLYWRNESRH